jgi:serine/threonine-protein kinase
MTPLQDPDNSLDEILAAYLESSEMGKPMDQCELLARHPEWASQLAAFFADQDRFAAYLQPLCPPAVSAGAESPCRSESVQDSAIPACGQRFGDYELQEVIARGGMGVVFKAGQISLSRIVALKMIRSGQLATPLEVERFRLEAEAAAKLDHPHIVPIYEVGSFEGLHFYSMKFIGGGNLAQQVSGPRSADEQERIARLMATVADAVHHAHQRGVLHRDLKPANILLDAEGQPHVTDFGLAKQVTQTGQGLCTPSGTAVGTPTYMAPEQALGPKNVTTAADIYSLGCILYELLTGQPPFKAETPLAVLMDVVERNPTPPAAVCPKLHRDLDTICLKCLEKEPDRRYASAAALADDLRRFVAGEAIQARPTGRLERLGRWCKRQPLLAGTLAALGLVVLSALALITWQWQRAETNFRESKEHEEAARRQLQLAENRLQLACDLVDEFCIRLSEDRLKVFQGTQRLRQELLEAGTKYYRTFLEQKGEDPPLRRQLAKAHYALATVLAGLGSRTEALKEYQAALALFDGMAGQGLGTAELQAVRAQILHRLGVLHSEAGQWTRALSFLQEAHGVFQSIAARTPQNDAVQTELAAVLGNMGNLYRFKGDPAGALPFLEKAMKIRKDMAARQPMNSRFQSLLAGTYLNYGNLVGTLSKDKESLDCYRLARDINEKLVKASPHEPDLQCALAHVLRVIGQQERLAGKTDKALKTLQDARSRLLRLVEENSEVVLFQRDLAATCREIGHFYSGRGKKNDALDWYRQGRDIMEKAQRLQPDLPEVWNDLAKCYFDMGTIYSSDRNQFDEGLKAFEKARDLREKVIRVSPDHPGYRHDLALTYKNVGVTLFNLGRSQEAMEATQRAADEHGQLVKTAPQIASYRRACSGDLGFLAELQWRNGHRDLALNSIRARAALWPNNGGELYTAARELAQFALAVRPGKQSEEPGSYLVQAQELVIKLLKKAVAAGFRDRQRLQQEKAFASLRPRPDFQAILAERK